MYEVRTRLAENGRIVIPAEIRRELGMKAGEQVVLSVCGKELRVTTLRERVAQVQEQMRAHFKPGTRLSEELLADRREEVRREQGGS